MIILFFVSLLLSYSSSTPAWWQFGEFLENQIKNHFPLAQSLPCEHFNLSDTQSQLCTDPRNQYLMISLGTSVNLAVDVCNKTFSKRRWNCPYTGGHSVFGEAAGQKSRESALLYAMVSAMAMYTVTRDCATGRLPGLCGCDGSKKPDSFVELPTDALSPWRPTVVLPTKVPWPSLVPHIFEEHPETVVHWGGCSEDVDFGYILTKAFIDPPHIHSRVNEVNELVKAHNNEVGRITVRRSTRIQCRCVGISGACNVHACWIEMKNWNAVGDDLKKKYDEAVKVKASSKNHLLKKSDATTRGFSEDDLVFVNASPDFCSVVSGRKCNISESAENYCSRLCCRGYKAVVKTVYYYCKPTLIRRPPIRVIYQTCKKDIVEHYCQ